MGTVAAGEKELEKIKSLNEEFGQERGTGSSLQAREVLNLEDLHL
jgi:septation ring formation regulator EzrA